MTDISNFKKTSKLMYMYLLIGIIAFGIISVWRIPEYVDVLGWDEGLYMQNGLLFTTKLQKAWGPMYAAWYYFLHFFQKHPLQLYLFNFQVLTMLPGVLFFIYWTRIGIRPMVAAVISMFYIASAINFHSWPKISLYTTSILIFTFIVSTYFQRKLDKVIVVAGGTLIASYMRPELYLAFVVLFLIILISIIYQLIKKLSIHKITWSLSGLLLIGIMGLQKVLGNPLFSFEGGRAIAAFAQHYAYNYSIWNHLRPDRWQLHGQEIFEADFGKNYDSYSAYKANPVVFMKHIHSNFINYLLNIWRFYTDLLLPESIFRLNEIWRTILLSITILGIIILKKINFSWWWNTMKSKWVEWILLLIVIGPTFLSVILIFPREHYMVMQVLLIMTLILSFSYGFTAWPPIGSTRNHLGLISAIILFLLWLAPNAKDRAYFDNFRDVKGNFNVQSARQLENFTLLKDTISISEDEGGIICFISEAKRDRYKWQPAMWKKSNFNHYSDSMGTQLYYVTPLMLYDDRYLLDSEWQDFIKNYPQRGFKKLEIAKEWYFLYDTTALTYYGNNNMRK
ncbi:MAG: hypothetical protein LC105_04635 [Chitinophagales bacterium]|nr:hypothetical protein [Chitinophagales bacterium]MCZ2393129.1 hypothetical protein [Chitinophagales bacterium]